MARILIAVLWVSLWTPTALACTCLPQRIESKIEAAAHVFRARVSGVGRAWFTIPGTELQAGPFAKPDFEIIAVLRGEPEKLGDVYAAPVTSCGVGLEVDHDYVFLVTVNLEFDFAFIGGCGAAIDLGLSPRSTPAWIEFLEGPGSGPDESVSREPNRGPVRRGAPAH